VPVEELFPGRLSATFRGWVDAVLLQNLGNDVVGQQAP
jgi:hypothetical protein